MREREREREREGGGGGGGRKLFSWKFLLYSSLMTSNCVAKSSSTRTPSREAMH